MLLIFIAFCCVSNQRRDSVIGEVRDKRNKGPLLSSGAKDRVLISDLLCRLLKLRSEKVDGH